MDWAAPQKYTCGREAPNAVATATQLDGHGALPLPEEKHSPELLIFLHLLGSALRSGRYKILSPLQKHQSSSAVRLYKL